MKLTEIDQTVGEYFSKDFTKQLEGVTPEEKMNGIREKNPFFIFSPDRIFSGPKKYGAPYIVPTETISILESRAEKRGEAPLRLFGSQEEINAKQFCFEALDESICDCCGRRIERYPWTIIKNTGTLCEACFQNLENHVHRVTSDIDFME